MTDFAAYIPVVNRPDLLENCVQRAAPVYEDLTVIDNSPDGWVPHSSRYTLYRPPIPFLFTQTMNWEMQDTLARGKKFCVHMHSDSVVPEGAFEKLLEETRKIDAAGRKWGVIYTLYDILAVYNPLAMQAIGGYDTNFKDYFSDNDWYYRLDIAGWERINTGITVGHGVDGAGSQTINSDPYLKYVNSITFPMYRTYYGAKWAGEPGKEHYNVPFGGHWRNG